MILSRKKSPNHKQLQFGGKNSKNARFMKTCRELDVLNHLLGNCLKIWRYSNILIFNQNYQCSFRNYFDTLWSYQMHFSGFQRFFPLFAEKSEEVILIRLSPDSIMSEYQFYPKKPDREVGPFFQGNVKIICRESK